MKNTPQLTKAKHVEELNESSREKEPPSSEPRDTPLVHPYAAELADMFLAVANRFMFYAKGSYMGHHKHSLSPMALKIDIRMTKLHLEGLERLCQAWLQEFLSEEEKT